MPGFLTQERQKINKNIRKKEKNSVQLRRQHLLFVGASFYRVITGRRLQRKVEIYKIRRREHG